MNISKADISHIDSIMVLLELVKKSMHEKKIFQWDESYPKRDDIMKDLELEQLFLLRDNYKIIAIFVLTEIIDEEYKDVKWLTINQNNIYIHRMAILPSEQGKGWGKKIMKWIEKYAIENKYSSIRLDTFTKNTYSNTLFKSMNYTKIQEISISKNDDKRYYCYEYIL